MSRSIRVLLAGALLVAVLGVGPAPAPADTKVAADGTTGFTPPPIKVAVVYSKTTIDWLNYRGTPSRYSHGSKEKAVLQYLQNRGYDVTEIVGDRDLLNSDALKQYDVIILPNMYALGRPASESLARYVAAGGGLVATMSSPRVDPAHAPKHGQKENMNEWWWRVMRSNYWEWGPLSSIYQAKFINDGKYTPEFTLRPNGASPITQGVSSILEARGMNGSVSGLTMHDPSCSIEMCVPIPKGADRQTAADFNIQTASVRKLYPGTYTAILGSSYGAGRCVRFFFPIMAFLHEYYDSALYPPLTSTGVPQGEVAGAYLESAIIWAASGDGTVAHSIDSTSYANVSARGGKVTARQYVTNRGNTITKGTVRFSVVSASGRTLKSWSTKNVLMLPHQTKTFRYTYGRKLPGGACTVVARFTYGYPATSVDARTQSVIFRGQSVRTQ